MHFTHHLVEFPPQLVQAAEAFVDAVLKGTIFQDTAISFTLGRRGSQIPPEKGVINVTCPWS
jgi:hypothetical protein